MAVPSPPEGLRASVLNPDVYLHDSAEAEELIARIASQAQGGKWRQAASNVRRLLADHADKLSPAEPGGYVSTPQRLNRLVASWPAEGLACYRELIEPEARRALGEARQDRQIESLLDLADRYFCTQAGAEAANVAAELALEAGDFALAASMYRRLLEEHPDRERLRGDATGRLAVVYALWGKTDLANRTAGQLEPEATIQWMGRGEPLRPLIDSLSRMIEAPAEPAGPFDWPTFVGNARRDRRVDLSLDRLALLWQAIGIGEGPSPARGDQSGSPPADRTLRRGQLLSMNPVLAQDAVYVQDARRVWALQVSSGNLLWTYTGVAEDTTQAGVTDTEVPEWHAVTVADSRVYACLGGEVVPYYGYETPENTSALVCLNAGTGELVWRADRASLGPAFDEMCFEATPVVADAKVHVVARRKRTFGFEDVFLYRLDAVSGCVDFRTHLGSASTGGFGYRRPTLTIPSLVDHTVYVVTNLGTVAAVNRYTGTVQWLRLYERISEGQWRREGRAATRELCSWQYNPLVCTDDRLFTLPTDSESLLVLERETGRIIFDAPIQDLCNVQTLLGVEGLRVYGVGDCVLAYDLESRAFLWQSVLPEDEELAGRGVLTSRHLLVPVRTGLCAFDRATGDIVARQPWESLEGGGNLLALPEQVIVAGADRVTAYARKEDVLGRLRDRMDRRPDDPLAALELAEVLFRTGDLEEALAVLDRAVTVAGGFARPIDAAVKRRLFDDCLAFAETLVQGGDFDFELVVRLYERASQCPPDTPAHLLYRLRWADLYEASERWNEAVALYQQILADRSLAPAEYRQGEGPPQPAGALAESAIARLIAAQGREVYAHFDAQAAQWLAAGRNSGDLDLLDRLIESYPNSLAAPPAWQARAEVLRKQNQFIEAARSLQTALGRYPLYTDPATLMKRIADCYRDAGRHRGAWRWLTKAAREYPNATAEVDGRQVSLLDYRATLGDAGGGAEPARPTVNPPLGATYKRDFDQECCLLEPLITDLPQADWRRYVVYSGGALRAFDARSNDEVWPAPAACPVQPDLLLATARHIVLATQYHVFCLDAEAGTPLWQFGRYPPQRDEPTADPEDFDVFVSFACSDDDLVALCSDGLAVALEVETGRTLWERRLDARPAGLLAANETWVVCQTARRGRPAFVVLAAADGEFVRLIDPADDRQVVRLLVTPLDDVLLVATDRVSCYAPATGRQRWNVQRDRSLLPGAAVLDLDGLYLPDEDLRVEKVDPLDGRTLWRSASPDSRAWPGPDGVSLHLYDGQVVVSTERLVYALAQGDGRTLWEGTVRRGARFRHRLIADSYLVAVDSPPEHFEEPLAVFFYDLRNASGLIPADGGVVTLGAFLDVKRITLRDGALLLQTGRAVHGWVGE